jgi:hypothetical protein
MRKAHPEGLFRSTNHLIVKRRTSIEITVLE